MLLKNEDIIDFDKLFSKKFESFCKNSPLALSFLSYADKVTIIFMGLFPKKTFTLDFSEPVNVNIANIKLYLHQHYYPIVVDEVVTENTLTPEEISDLIVEHNISFEEAIQRHGSTITLIPHRIEKIIHKENLLQIRNLDTEVVSLLQPKVPVAVIQQHLFNTQLNNKSEFTSLQKKLFKQITNNAKIVWCSDTTGENHESK